MFANYRLRELRFLLLTGDYLPNTRVRELINRKPSKLKRIVLEGLRWSTIGGMLWTAVLLVLWLPLRGLIALIMALFVVTTDHEYGHYKPMVRYGIIPERIGMGLWHGPFKHFQIKIPIKITRRHRDGTPMYDRSGNKIKEPSELWIQPLTFMFVGYVEEGEAGRRAIAALPPEARAEIFGGGVVRNLRMAFVMALIVGFYYWDGTVDSLSILVLASVFILGVVGHAFGIHKNVSNKGWRRMNSQTAGVALLGVVAMVSVEGWAGFDQLGIELWFLVPVAMTVFLHLYLPIVARWWMPLIGLAVFIWLSAWILPNLLTDFNHATKTGGANSGEPAIFMGPVSLWQMFALGGGESEPTAHLVRLLGDELVGAWQSIADDWMFTIWLTLVTSLGFFLVNTMPMVQTDGGYMWSNFLDPKHRRTSVSKIAVTVPSIVLGIPILIILLRTELGDWFLLAAIVLTVVLLVDKFVRSRIRKANQLMVMMGYIANRHQLDPFARI